MTLALVSTGFQVVMVLNCQKNDSVSISNLLCFFPASLLRIQPGHACQRKKQDAIRITIIMTGTAICPKNRRLLPQVGEMLSTFPGFFKTKFVTSILSPATHPTFTESLFVQRATSKSFEWIFQS